MRAPLLHVAPAGGTRWSGGHAVGTTIPSRSRRSALSTNRCNRDVPSAQGEQMRRRCSPLSRIKGRGDAAVQLERMSRSRRRITSWPASTRFTNGRRTSRAISRHSRASATMPLKNCSV